MFLFFSKLAGFFLTPSYWIVALLIWLLVTKSAILKKRIIITIVILIFVFGNEFLYTKAVLGWQAKPVQLRDSSYDAGIILGGLISFDKNGIGFFNNAADRFIQTILLYKTGKIKKIFISAGSLDPTKPKEADYSFRKMLEAGIPAGDIIIENSSRTTAENAAYTRRTLDSMHLKPPFVLITSATHIPRATKVFARAGIEVVPYPCNFTIIDKKFSVTDYLLPKLSILDNWYGLLKEIVGLAGYKLFGRA